MVPLSEAYVAYPHLVPLQLTHNAATWHLPYHSTDKFPSWNRLGQKKAPKMWLKAMKMERKELVLIVVVMMEVE